MLGVYIINGLVPSLQLQQKMQPQSMEPTHGNNNIAQSWGQDISRSTIPYGTSSHNKIHWECLHQMTYVQTSRLMSSSIGCVTSGRRHGVCWTNSLTRSRPCRCNAKVSSRCVVGNSSGCVTAFRETVLQTMNTWDVYFCKESIDKDLFAMGLCQMH